MKLAQNQCSYAHAKVSFNICDQGAQNMIGGLASLSFPVPANPSYDLSVLMKDTQNGFSYHMPKLSADES